MMKRFIFVVYLLLAVLPLQSIATSNMIICKNMSSSQIKAHACHEPDVQKSHEKDHAEHSSNAKLNCVVLCASLCAATTMSNTMTFHLLSATQIAFTPLQTIYTSITSPSLLRPPIA